MSEIDKGMWSVDLSYDSKSLIKDGKRWYPFMGEMHYSRVDHQDWKDELRKIKAGGIDILSCYVIWIHHEEVEGEWEFDHNKNIRKFVETCQEVGLYVFLRIGPWVHAEVRNGGFPDWLMNKGCDLRTNDPEYLKEVDIFFAKIYEQVQGLFLKDKGPIMGLQIENEYAHAGGGISGEEGNKHMNILKEMAVNIGYQVPYYTATGWGGACIGDMMPVYGGYCDAPWDRSLEKLPPNVNYEFRSDRNDTLIANDHSEGLVQNKEDEDFPYITCELGGGLQMTQHRRVVTLADDIGSMSLVKIGSGADLLGYYMYHGGTNPMGKLSSLQESKATGYPNDLPIYSYDFQGPIREFGQRGPAYEPIRFLKGFIDVAKEKILGSQLYIGIDTKVRYSIRGQWSDDVFDGYLFINNYQRLYPMDEQVLSSVKYMDDDHEIDIQLPDLMIPSQSYFAFPIQFNNRGQLINLTKAIPFMVLNESESNETYVYALDYLDEKLKLDEVEINCSTILSRNDALISHKIKVEDKEYCLVYDGIVDQAGKDLYLYGNDKTKVRLIPENKDLEARIIDAQSNFDGKEVKVKIVSDEYIEEYQGITLELDYEELDDLNEGIDNIILSIGFYGERAEVYVDDEMIHDCYGSALTYELGLKKWSYPKALNFRFYPQVHWDQVYYDGDKESFKDKVEAEDIKVTILGKQIVKL